jgi:hypothetical protein
MATDSPRINGPASLVLSPRCVRSLCAAGLALPWYGRFAMGAMRRGRQRHEVAGERSVMSTGWLWLVAALAGGLVWAAPAPAEKAEPGPSSSD